MLTVKAVVHFFGVDTFSGDNGPTALIANGNYAFVDANGASNPPFSVGVPVGQSINSTMQEIISAIVADALVKGFVIEAQDILLPVLQRGT